MPVKTLETRASLLIQIQDCDDQEAWGEFVRLYTPLVFRFYRGRGLTEQDALDLTQEVMRAISKSIQSFKYDPSKGTFRSWFYTVARRRLSDFFSKQARRPQLEGGETAMRQLHQEADPRDEQDWDLEYKKQLFHWAAEKVRVKFSDRAWSAFWWTAVDERDPEQVGKELGLSRGAVYAAKARVTGALRECVRMVAGEWDLHVA